MGEAEKRKLDWCGGTRSWRASGASLASLVSLIVLLFFIFPLLLRTVLTALFSALLFLDTFSLSYVIDSLGWLHGQLTVLHLRYECHLNLKVCIFFCFPSLSRDCPWHSLNLYTFFVDPLSLSQNKLPLLCFLYFQAQPFLHHFKCFQRPGSNP